MKLKKIKLSGFKSFVDATTVSFPSQLTGIVGPNGCGKSNVIDAVRWVMGESSAKNLRGDSMADVIFNGSTSRKPVGVASIELLFDNSEGRLQGQYTNYSEISIRRQVTREGQSSYFLNGTRCRRKDITDVFLGTGLGPRSYAIIEQGTISRLIEARPEELRVFLEEAAGISKYKERRRETENRIKHTRENLERVNDLVDEVSKQLRHLERQAKTAEKYQEYKKQERLLQAQLDALRWQDLDDQVQQEQNNVQQFENQIQQANAEKYRLEAALENTREQHFEANEEFNRIQGEYYRIGAEIARVEQAIQHSRERRQQLETDIESVQGNIEHTERELDNDRERLQALEEEQVELEQSLVEARQEERQTADAMTQWEQRMQQWQTQWDEFNRQATQPSQTAQVEKTRIQQLEGNSLQVAQRCERLEEENRSLQLGGIEQEIDELRRQSDDTDGQLETLQQARQENQSALNQTREQIKTLDDELAQGREQAQQLRGRLASLEALQQDALKLEQTQTREWLQQQQIEQAPRLAQSIEVDSGWEAAVECVLGNYLEAVCVEQLQQLIPQLPRLQSELMLLQGRPNPMQFPPADTLLSKIQSPYDLRHILGNVYIADSLEQAMTRLEGMESGSIVTREGIWLGKGWVRVLNKDADNDSVLARERQIKEIQSTLAPLTEQLEQWQQQLEQLREQLAQREQQAAQMHDQWEQLRHDHTQLQSALSAKQTRMEHAKQRKQQLDTELAEQNEKLLELEKDIKEAYGRLNEALGIMEEHAQQREQLIAQRDEFSEQLSASRQSAKDSAARCHGLEIRFESVRVNTESIHQSIERLENQLQQARQRLEELHDVAQRVHTPEQELNEQLEQQLQARVDIEQKLSEQRSHVESFEDQLRGISQQIHEVEQQLQEIRDKLDQLRLHWQELNVRRQTVSEHLAETGYELEQVLQEIPEEADIDTWHDDLEQLRQRISRLGNINLAAIDEFAQQSERKQYLDAQVADLTEALETLERAIAKIDRETREKFKETFNKVNKGFGELFPRLFGGGSAYLEMTGEDLLDCGISVMARPPGKRNSTIHLLSGGEKALTAVAMVFSLFNLNPAPFCMLDEVDAPLDDANVGRFCNMVKEMSELVQFIVITHNKITMEMSHQLTGVTMHEPGVSRLVAVDVEEAVELAAI